LGTAAVGTASSGKAYATGGAPQGPQQDGKAGVMGISSSPVSK